MKSSFAKFSHVINELNNKLEAAQADRPSCVMSWQRLLSCQDRKTALKARQLTNMITIGHAG